MEVTKDCRDQLCLHCFLSGLPVRLGTYLLSWLFLGLQQQGW